jgi:hypothetical protein
LGGSSVPITFNGGGIQVLGTGITAFPGTHPVTYTASRAIGFDVATAASHALTVDFCVSDDDDHLHEEWRGHPRADAASNQFATCR